ncbi:hypothetical protein PG985_008932 [Apiospora marii]|uniref:uncharacterized protein n=1 Tax=Apiospora marii TaxID=335849 RepID=UPI00312F76C6
MLLLLLPRSRMGSKRAAAATAAARRRHPGPRAGRPGSLAFGSILPGELLFPASSAGRAIHSFAFRGLGGASAERHYDDCTPKYRARICLHFSFGSVSRRTHQDAQTDCSFPLLAQKEGIAHATAPTPHSEMRVWRCSSPNSTNTLAEQSLPHLILSHPIPIPIPIPIPHRTPCRARIYLPVP